MANLKPTQSIKGNIANSNAIHGNITPTNPIKGKISTEITDASEAKRGIVRLATIEEVVIGEDNTTAITPQKLRTVTHYVHEQGIASDTWVINHNLNKKPSITIVDSADNVVEGAERYINENTVEIRFNGAFKGKAYLN